MSKNISMKTNSLYLIILLLVGCTNSTKVENIQDKSNMFAPPYTFPPMVLPPIKSSSIKNNTNNLAEVQINKIPHPFDLNGHIPCAVWVNGSRLKLSPLDAQKVAKAINLDAHPTIHSARLHQGEGWLTPLKK